MPSSNKRTIILTLAGLLILASSASLIIGHNTTDSPTPASDIEIEETENTEGAIENNTIIPVVVDSLAQNEGIHSPLAITGTAIGLWFFEADFPIVLKDGNGTTLATAIATAKSNWMTVDYVPFEATLEFDTPTTTTGTLEFRKDNPSGMSEHDATYILPIRF